MLTLLLETSTERGLVAVAKGSDVLGYRTIDTMINQAKVLMPTIQNLLQELKIAPKELQRIGVGIGPGSYTGIRVSVTIAKVMAFTTGIPLVGVPSLMTFIPNKEGVFATVIDARIGGFYCITGRKTYRETHFAIEPSLVTLKDVKQLLKSIPLLLSPNVQALKLRLEAISPFPKWEWEQCGPDAAQMAATVDQFHHNGKWSTDGQLKLLYLRRTQAEIELEEKKGKV